MLRTYRESRAWPGLRGGEAELGLPQGMLDLEETQPALILTLHSLQTDQQPFSKESLSQAAAWVADGRLDPPGKLHGEPGKGLQARLLVQLGRVGVAVHRHSSLKAKQEGSGGRTESTEAGLWLMFWAQHASCVCTPNKTEVPG